MTRNRPTPEGREIGKMRYNFDRIRHGKVMAEDIAVHAGSLEEAIMRAEELMGDDTDSIAFTDNESCVPATRCPICATLSEGGENG